MRDEIISLYQTVLDKKDNPSEESYTAYLFKKGLDKILKKCAEECAEVIIAAKNGNKQETVLEISDLIYHIIAMMVYQGIDLQEVVKELAFRSEKTDNLKKFYDIDKNT